MISSFNINNQLKKFEYFGSPIYIDKIENFDDFFNLYSDFYIYSRLASRKFLKAV